MELWRQRVGDCIGFDWDRQVTTAPLTIVVIDRQWTASRHIINIDQVILDLRARYPSAHIELHYLERLTLKQQAQIYNRASIVMWVHGASMANLIFLPRRAVGLHIVPRPHVPENLDWPEELVRDLSNEVSVSAVLACLFLHMGVMQDCFCATYTLLHWDLEVSHRFPASLCSISYLKAPWSRDYHENISSSVSPDFPCSLCTALLCVVHCRTEPVGGVTKLSHTAVISQAAYTGHGF